MVVGSRLWSGTYVFCIGFVLFIVLWDIALAVILQLLLPVCDMQCIQIYPVWDQEKGHEN